MRNPTKKQVQKVIDNFMKVLPMAQKMDRKKTLCSVDMQQGSIPKDASIKHACGTPMCHGGWYVIATASERLGSKYFDYMSGSNKMANHLGFKTEGDLEMWAMGNDDIWGNNNGHRMFYNPLAFNYKGNLTLAKIINHWKGVQKKTTKVNFYG